MVEAIEMVEIGGGCPDLFWDVTTLHKVLRKVLDKSFQAPMLAEINYHVWVGGGWLDQMKLRLTQPSLV